MSMIYKNGRKALFILGLIVALMMLLTVLKFEGLNYAGYEVIFGKEIFDVNPFDLGSIASAYLPFSFSALLAFTLPLIAGIIALVSKKLPLVSLVLLVAGLIFLIRLPDTIEIVYVLAGSENSTEIDWTMGLGLMGALVFSSLATVLNVFLVVSDK